MRAQPRFTFLTVCVCLISAIAVTADRIGAAQSAAPVKAPAKAQPAAAPAKREMLQITVVKIKPELVTEWLAFQKNETIPMLKKAGIVRRDAWQTAVFGDGAMYAFVTPIESFTRYDGDAPAVRALGAEGARSYAEKNRRFVDATRTYAEQTRPDLGNDVKMTAPPKLALLSDVQIAMGKVPAYEALIKSDVLPVMRKAHLGYVVTQTVLGGDVSSFTTLIFYDSFADIGLGHPFQRILGAEGERQLSTKAAGIVTHLERSVIRYVPELSFGPPPST